MADAHDSGERRIFLVHLFDVGVGGRAKFLNSCCLCIQVDNEILKLRGERLELLIGNALGNFLFLCCGDWFPDALKKDLVVVFFDDCSKDAAHVVAGSNALWHIQLTNL